MSETKNAYVERQTSNIKVWQEEIVKLQAKVDKAHASRHERMNRHIAELKEKRAGFEDKVSEIQKTGEAVWEELKTGADKSFKELDKSFKTVQAFFH